MVRILALGIPGTVAGKTIRGPWVTWLLAIATLVATPALAQPGSISGMITTAAKGAAPVRVTIDQKICGDQLPDESIVVDAQGRLANAVVMVTGVKRHFPAEPLITNEKCRFTPRVHLIGPRATVKTTSRDPMLHTTNAQLESGRTLFNVALPIAGITITKAIAATGNVRLSCNTHPWMKGWLVVTNEAAAISGGDGRFTIDNVPPGTYELRVWHEALKGAPQKVTVSAGKPTDVSFQLK